jgi:hypothetical protein
MKRVYMKPEALVIVPMYSEHILQSASDSERNAAGGPTDTGDGINLPGTVGETDDDTDPYGGHGQGSGGGGNRSKTGMIWDEW